jgi:hypothetical protein
MQVGDLVRFTITGLGAPERLVTGVLLQRIALSFWKVHAPSIAAHLCFDEEELEVISASR